MPQGPLPTCECIGSFYPTIVWQWIYCALLANNTLLEGISGGTLDAQVQGTSADGTPASGNPIQVGGVDAAGNVQPLLTDTSGALTTASQGYSAQVTITRPANQTPYTAGDVLGGALTIPLIGPLGGRVFLTTLALMPQIAAIPTGMTSFRLHLYSATPPSAIADNSPWTFTSVDWPSYLGYVDLGTPVDFGAALFAQVTQVDQQVKLATTSLFAYLIPNGGFTPAANSEVYRLDVNSVGI